MVKTAFINDLKRLRYKRYDVCSMLQCTMPTLKSRINNPETFTINEIVVLKDNGFYSLCEKLINIIYNENNKNSKQ